MTQLSPTAQNLNWLISNFVHKVPGVAHGGTVAPEGPTSTVRVTDFFAQALAA